MPLKSAPSPSKRSKKYPNLQNCRIGIVISEWNQDITSSMLKGAKNILQKCNIEKDNIIVERVPGSFELPLGAQYIAKYKNVDAVICLGCVIQGETRHFEFICQAVSQGVTNVGLNHNIPVIFGVLTTDNMQQAIERSVGNINNKGIESALTAVKMIELHNKLKNK